MRRYLKAGHMVTTGSERHEYSVVSAQEVGGKRFVIVRNPHGSELKDEMRIDDNELQKTLKELGGELKDYEFNKNDG